MKLNNKNLNEKRIIDILSLNNIDNEIVSIKYQNYNKIFIKIRENEELYLLKLCLDKHSMNLSKKEASGYKYFEQPEKTRFLLPKYKLINVHNDYVLSKIKFIVGKNAHYLDFKKLYNVNYQEEIKYIDLDKYINLIKNKFINNHQGKKNEINQIIDDFCLNNKSFNLPIEASHGDFVHYNTIKYQNHYFVFDLEYFDKDRVYLFDFFHWYLTPIFYKLIRHNNILKFIGNVYLILIELFSNQVKNDQNRYILDDKYSFKVILIVFLIEKRFLLKTGLNLKNINELMSNKKKELTVKNIILIEKLIFENIKSLENL